MTNQNFSRGKVFHHTVKSRKAVPCSLSAPVKGSVLLFLESKAFESLLSWLLNVIKRKWTGGCWLKSCRRKFSSCLFRKEVGPGWRVQMTPRYRRAPPTPPNPPRPPFLLPQPNPLTHLLFSFAFSPMYQDVYLPGKTYPSLREPSWRNNGWSPLVLSQCRNVARVVGYNTSNFGEDVLSKLIDFFVTEIFSVVNSGLGGSFGENTLNLLFSFGLFPPHCFYYFPALCLLLPIFLCCPWTSIWARKCFVDHQNTEIPRQTDKTRFTCSDSLE